MLWIWILWAVLLLAAAVVLGLGYALYRGLLYHTTPDPEAAPTLPPSAKTPPEMHRRITADMAYLQAQPFEAVHITADDGTALYARYYHHTDSAPLALVFHGYKGSALVDGVGGFRILKALGYNVLLPDQRACGHSGGHTITLGIKEQYDCRAWADWAAARFGPETPLFLMGVSMGASTVLLATGLPLPANVRGVIADCGFTSPKAIAKKCIRQWYHVPPAPLYAIGRVAGLLYGGVDLNRADCRTALAGSQLPVLLLHGDADDFVPCEMSRENYAASAAPDKQLLMVPGAPHALAYYYGTEEYTRAVTEFCRRTEKN